MSRQTYLLTFAVLFSAITGSVLAAGPVYWDGGGADSSWCTPENWVGDFVPATDYNLWMAGANDWDWEDLNEPYIDELVSLPVIIDGTCAAAHCGMVVVGDTTDIGVGLIVEEGGLFRPHEIVIGYNTRGSGTMIVNGGVVDTWDYSYVGIGDGGDGTLIMNGGVINCLGNTSGGGSAPQWAGAVIVCKNEKGSATGHFQFNGGLIRTRRLSIFEGGTMDVAGGTMIITRVGDSSIESWYGDQFWNINSWIEQGWLTAYGGERAEIEMHYNEVGGVIILEAFQYDPNIAWNPNPRHGEQDVSPATMLTWNPGDNAVSHDVYFGEDRTALEEANNAPGVWEEYKGNYDVNSWDPCGLEFDKTYYWRVDELNPSDPCSPWKGRVWRFRTAEYVLIEDFDSYASTDDLYGSWSDGWTNYTSSEVFIETADVNFIIDGNSMRYFYRNSADPFYSESTHIFSPAMDWTVAGVEGLVLWFHGEPTNTAERMYLRVSDSPGNTATVEYEDPNDLIQDADDAWYEWGIRLEDFNSADVNLHDINGITIGFGNRESPQEGGDGMVYFENIRLYPLLCRGEYSDSSGDFTGDCFVDSNDLGEFSSTWMISDGEATAETPSGDPVVWYKFDEGTGMVATDSAGSYDGVLPESPSTPTWVTPGVQEPNAADPNYALDFDGIDDYVEVPPLDLNSNTVTISAWVKGEIPQVSWAGIVFSRNANSCAGLSVGESQTLAYHWNWDNWSWDSGLVLPDNEWIFVALVVEPMQATLHMSDGITFSFATNIVSHDAEEFDGLTYVGWDQEGSSNRYFNGLIDDVRIYDYCLSTGEIMGLAGVEGIVYVPNELRTNLVPKVGDEGVYNLDNPDIINLRDYAVMADSWLAEILWP